MEIFLIKNGANLKTQNTVNKDTDFILTIFPLYFELDYFLPKLHFLNRFLSLGRKSRVVLIICFIFVGQF